MGHHWKDNWARTAEHFKRWWHHEGLVVTAPCAIRHDPPRIDEEEPPPRSREEYFLDNAYRIRRRHWQLARMEFPLDNLPIADTDFGPGAFGTYLGAEPKIAPNTIWYEHCWGDVPDPRGLKLPPLEPPNRWYQLALDLLRETKKVAADNYFTGFPDLIEHVDTLAALRDPQTLMMDMALYPDWVESMLIELNKLWFKVYDTMYDIIREPDGSSVFQAFSLWAPGKTAKIQCDNAAMISPAMFRRFVVPRLREQCQFLDYSMFHLDGPDCLCHVDALLEIEELDAIEWTPGPKVPRGGDLHWKELYRRILDAGKSVQIVWVEESNIRPLLDTLGPKGLYLCLCTRLENWDDVERIETILAPYGY